MKKRIMSLLIVFVLIFSCFTPVSAAGGVQINRDSVTLVSGGTFQLSVTVNGVKKSASWGSSDTSVATVSSSGLVTGKAAGSAVITGMVNGSTVECLVSVLKRSNSSTYRYNVLILDASGSMRGKPDTSQKQAAKRFCTKVLSTRGNNYVAIVALNSSSPTICGFTDNYATLARCINQISCGGNTNMNTALIRAGNLLNSISMSGSRVMKNIVLCSDGLPTVGTRTYSGRYSASSHKWYSYANAAYNTASKLNKKNYFIYALGFFHSSTGNDLKFGKRLMKDLASKDRYYVIDDPDDLDPVFDNIADRITTLALNKKSITIYVGDTYQLYATVNGVRKTAQWKSSDSSVASVNSKGLVTGKKKGTATVTASIGGKSVSCKVTVKNKVSLKLNKYKATIYVKEKLALKAIVKGTGKKVTWKSSDSSIASVNSKGVVTGKKVGKATITASVAGVSKKCVITVKKAKHPLYSMYFQYNTTRHRGTNKLINENGLRIVLNDGAVIEKCGAYVHKSGNYWYCTMAFKGTGVTSATLSAYLAYNGKIVEDGMTGSVMNKFSMYKDSDGIWSMKGTWDSVRFVSCDIYGNNLANSSIGKQSENTKMFTSMSEMKKWLRK